MEENNMNQEKESDGGKAVQGDEVHGDKVMGDKVGGDKVGGDKITVGNVSGTGVAIGRGASATVTQGVSGAELAQLFSVVYQQIEARRDDPDVDKEEIQEQVQKIENEAANGEEANPSKVERWLNGLLQMAPDIFDVTVATLTNPIAGVATVIRKVAQKAKEESGRDFSE
jgi:hypothetical protein